VQGRNLLADYGVLGCFVDIDLRPVRVLFGDVCVGEDRFDRTLRDARVTIDASVGVYIKPIRQFVKCLDRADCGAVCVLTINAHLNNNVGHSMMTPFNKSIVYYLSSGMSTRIFNESKASMQVPDEVLFFTIVN
jgi:hypothetical protein